MVNQAPNVVALYCSHREDGEGCGVRITGLTIEQASRIVTLASGGCLAALADEGKIVIPEGGTRSGICLKAVVGTSIPA